MNIGKVAIVIVNWNKCEYLKRLLSSIKTLDYNNYEIIVVDNASTDGSVDAVRALPYVHLICNTENLGGTGGFNTGIRYVLLRKSYKYIWLLDNDVTVTSTALTGLVDTMESDPLIGLVGSRVINAEKPDYVVETGAFFDWKAGTVRPVDRNIHKLESTSTGVIDVDYVAVCSALVRVSALSEVGLMDERHFLFWDDMDWGIAFKQAGYRVVAVPASEVYHAAFTEYRSVVVDAYYGVRNQLLTFSKYRFIRGAYWGLFNNLRRISKNGLLMLLSNKPGGRLVFLACWDYFRGRWGKIPWMLSVHASAKNEQMSQIIDVPQGGRVLVIPTHDAKSTTEVVNFLWERGASCVDVIIPKDRKMLFSGLHFSHLITIDYFSGSVIINTWRVFRQIIKTNYDIGVKVSDEKISPFSYAIPISAYYCKHKRVLLRTKESRSQIWQLIFASVFGELLGVLMFSLAGVRGFSLVRRRS